MRRALKPLEGRLAALGMTALAASVLYYLTIQWWVVAPLQAIDEEMVALRQAQQRYAALLAQREPLRRQLDASLAANTDADSLLPGEDPSAGAAVLMQQVAATVARHQRLGAGCELLNRTPMAGRPGDAAYVEVRLSIGLNCAIEPLAAILYALEHELPLLVVDELAIRRDASAPERGGAGRLRVQLLLSGYLRRADAARPGAGS